MPCGCHEASEVAKLASATSFFTFGLFTGLHCILMCGPISAIFLLRSETFIPSWFRYHLARTIAYILVGLLVATVGIVLTDYVSLEVLAIGVLVPMLLHAGGFFRRVKPGFSIFHRLSSKYFQRIPKKHLPFWFGFGSPLIPCGLLYTAFSACALAPHIWVGGAWMAIFALGTVSVFGLTQILGSKFAGKLRLIPVDHLTRLAALAGAVIIFVMVFVL